MNTDTPPQPAQDPWVPLADVLTLINHPNFHWCVGGLEELKYIELRIDTRDNCCLVKTRNGKQVDMAKVAKALELPYLKGMNENPAVEVHSKETMDEVREALKAAEEHLRLYEVQIDGQCGGCRSDEEMEQEKLWGGAIYAARSAFAKLNPPQ